MLSDELRGQTQYLNIYINPKWSPCIDSTYSFIDDVNKYSAIFPVWFGIWISFVNRKIVRRQTGVVGGLF